MKVNQLWEIRWCGRDGVNVPEEEFLWVLARNSAEAAKKATKFLRRKKNKAKITAISEHGTIDIF